MQRRFSPIPATIFIVAVFSLALALGSHAGNSPDPDADYDRLDGTGTSGKKVDVIEWEGNLEIHVTPIGSLKGLALKLDKKNKNKPVMVIGYRFDTDPKTQLIRRAILGIPINEGFHVYRDKTIEDYDKIIISNNTITSDQLALFKLDPDPKQLYPDGHPALAAKEDDKKKKSDRVPASASVAPHKGSDEVLDGDDDGTIKPYQF